MDSIILGRYVSTNALAAVGTSNPLMTLVLLFVNGICLGAGILVSYHFGAKDTDTLARQASTGFVAGGLFSLLVGALGVLFAPYVLTLIQVEKEILPLASLYLRIIMAGLVFTFLYNYLASLLRAMGDAKSPLYFLALSALLNIVGDVVLVVYCRMGVQGAAISTIACEALSAMLCWWYTSKTIPELNLGKRWFVFDMTLLQKTLRYGIYSALQQSVVQLGKVITQGMVNGLGIEATAAFNATNRVDDYTIVPQQNIAHAMTSIMAQNLGANQQPRALKTFHYGMYLEVGFGVIMGILLFVGKTTIMRLFTSDPFVISLGARFLGITAWLYILPGITNGLQGYFRSLGHMRITFIASSLSMVVRLSSLVILLYVFHLGFSSLPIAYGLGWLAMIVYEGILLYVRRSTFKI